MRTYIGVIGMAAAATATAFALAVPAFAQPPGPASQGAGGQTVNQECSPNVLSHVIHVPVLNSGANRSC
jgi:hypothetical protein